MAGQHDIEVRLARDEIRTLLGVIEEYLTSGPDRLLGPGAPLRRVHATLRLAVDQADRGAAAPGSLAASSSVGARD